MKLILIFGTILNLNMVIAMDNDGPDCRVWFGNSVGAFSSYNVRIENHSCEQVMDEILKKERSGDEVSK